MPEQDKGPEESAAEKGSPSVDRQDMDEKSAGFRPAQPPTQTDVQMVEDNMPASRPATAESDDVEVSEDAGDEADAVNHASPPAAKPGEKNDPDMKDMAIGPRPTDDEAAG